MRRVLRALLAAAFSLLLLPGAAHAADNSLADYAARLAQARAASIKALADASVTAQEAATVSSAVLDVLPPSERVEQDGVSIAVDNAVAVSLAQRLGAATTRTDRTRIAKDLDAHLAALVRTAGVPGASVPQDAAALEGLLREQQVQARNPLSEWFAGLVDRLGKFLTNWWEGAGSSAGVTTAMRLGTVAVLVAMAAGLLWMLARAYARMRAGTAARRVAQPGGGADAIVAAAEGLPADALSFADSLAAEERWRDAVRALFGGAARELVRAGYVLEAHRRTNGELLLELRPEAPATYEPLAALCAQFERAWYGHHDPGPDGFGRSRELYERVLVTLQAPADEAGERP